MSCCGDKIIAIRQGLEWSRLLRVPPEVLKKKTNYLNANLLFQIKIKEEIMKLTKSLVMQRI